MVEGTEMPLPVYQCHKRVMAVKIGSVQLMPGQTSRHSYGALLHHACGAIRVNGLYVEQHNPKAGGYYVLDADGCESYSPSAAFESGYTRVPGATEFDSEPFTAAGMDGLSETDVRLRCLEMATGLKREGMDPVETAERFLAFVSGDSHPERSPSDDVYA
ncbi:MAG: hypothetical protein RJQ08_13735 [Salinisphaeraceae bacterium]